MFGNSLIGEHCCTNRTCKNFVQEGGTVYYPVRLERAMNGVGAYTVGGTDDILWTDKEKTELNRQYKHVIENDMQCPFCNQKLVYDEAA